MSYLIRIFCRIWDFSYQLRVSKNAEFLVSKWSGSTKTSHRQTHKQTDTSGIMYIGFPMPIALSCLSISSLFRRRRKPNLFRMMFIWMGFRLCTVHLMVILSVSNLSTCFPPSLTASFCPVDYILQITPPHLLISAVLCLYCKIIILYYYSD